MKKSILTTALFAAATMMASSGFAEKLTCTMSANIATKSGLMPTNTSPVWQTEIQSDETAEIKKCSQYSFLNENRIIFCAKKTPSKGVYSAVLFSSDGADVSEEFFGTSVKNVDNLISIHAAQSVLPSLLQELELAKVPVSENYTGDSLTLDNAIVLASKKSNVNLDGHLATLGFKNCQLSK